METDKQLVDYEVESKKLEEAQNRPDFWNPTEGKYEISILSEIERYAYMDSEGKEQNRAKVSIEFEGTEYVWSFGIGQTKASLYGQLVEAAHKKSNTLTGQKVTVVIKFDGKKRDFTIVS